MVKTITHGNWEDPAIWSTHSVPTIADSIIIYHYVVVNQNFNIQTPTLLYVDFSGTICGNYLMEINCGATFKNYGHIYLNQIKTGSGVNYNVIQCKSYITIIGCSATPNGFYSLPPNGYVAVWPPVFCQTTNTNWEGGTTTGLTEIETTNLSIYPNPISGGELMVITLNKTFFKLTDILGKLIISANFSDKISIQMDDLPNGIYFLELEIDGKTQTKKILKIN